MFVPRGGHKNGRFLVTKLGSGALAGMQESTELGVEAESRGRGRSG